MQTFVYMMLQSQILVIVCTGFFMMLRPFTQKRQTAQWHFNLLKVICIFVFPPIQSFFVKASGFAMDFSKIVISYENTTIYRTISTPLFKVSDVVANASVAQELLSGMMVVWCIGIVVQLACLRSSFLRFSRNITNAIEVTDKRLLNILDASKKQLQLYQPLTVLQSEKISSPFLVGVVHPCILLPSAVITNDSVHHILKHELLHVKRKDMYWKWFSLSLRILYWWNPFIYLLTAQLNRFLEYSCDETTVCCLNTKERKEYAHMLLIFAAKSKQIPFLQSSLAFSNEKRNMKERIENIMKQKKSNLAISILVVIALISLFAVPVFANAMIEAARVPDLVGLSVTEAESVLTQNGLAFFKIA